jgi:cytochrome b561
MPALLLYFCRPSLQRRLPAVSPIASPPAYEAAEASLSHSSLTLTQVLVVSTGPACML